jgi:hypothetical protein
MTLWRGGVFQTLGFWVAITYPLGCPSFVLPGYPSKPTTWFGTKLSDAMTEDAFTFEEMKKLDQRLKSLEDATPGYLMDFYEPHLSSFSIKPGSDTKMSITSTCYAIRAILSSDDPNAFEVNLGSILQDIVKSEWRENDIYQVSLILLILLRADPERKTLNHSNSETTSNISKLVSLLLTARPKRRFGDQQIFSDYICYICCRVYALLHDSTKRDEDGTLLVGGMSRDLALEENAASEISVALTRAGEISFNELCRQMAYRSAGDSSSFDVIRLAYSLLSYLTATASLQHTAGRELVVGEGAAAGTETVKMNKRLAQAALAAFFDEQQDDGLWDRGQPIYKSFRRQGRNIGNAYVFAVDALGSLLEIIPAEDFRPHLRQLQKTLEWIETHQSVEVIADYCDTVSGQCYGKSLRGWSSPHLSPGSGPQAWSTAQVTTCVARMRRTIRQLLHNDVLEEFDGISVSKLGPRPAAWDRLLDSDLGSPTGEARAIKSVLEERVCTPFADSVSNPSVGAAYSVILFGSPGTAKTTICESVAQKMGWDFVVIDTAAFLADGLTNVASRIRYVFTRLQALRSCVILFDEIEEFCLDRETPGISMESRMLTTAMLTAINDLRRTKQSVFFLATNRLRAFDAAIIRPGRFDVQLFVGTPNLGARVILFEQAISGVSLSEEAKQKAIGTYSEFLNSVWSEDEDAMFMNYLEGKQFASSAASILTKGRELETSELELILKQQAAVMTCRGSVRDEYKAQMGLSRL